MNAPITEAQLQAAAVAPRVTLDQVMAAIEGESYTLLPDGTTTIAQLSMANGRFSSVGKSSYVSKDNFNPEIGRELAKKDAVGQIWPLLGFSLAQKLAMIDAAGPATGAIVTQLGARPLTYVGTKVVRAVPMNRLTYSELRGWTVPADENPDDAGYLVEYVDGGKPNVEGFTGYISWSPKDVFECAYTLGAEPKPTTFLDRLKVEAEELEAKWGKLRLFIATPEFSNLNSLEQKDLKEQADHMEDYLWVLKRRIKRATSVAAETSPVALGHPVK
ncbi:Gp49 family protein [Paraburkholderia sp. SIMBA_049]